jgi:hypothetical protein
MPTENILVVSGITLAFLIFAAVLAWGDYYTRNVHHDHS